MSRYFCDAAASHCGCCSNSRASPIWPICGQASRIEIQVQRQRARLDLVAQGRELLHGLRQRCARPGDPAARRRSARRRGCAASCHPGLDPGSILARHHGCRIESGMTVCIGCRQRGAVHRRRPAHDIEQQSRVGHRARQRPYDLEVQQQTRQHMLARHGAERWLESHQAGVGGRPADRASAILADRQRRDAAGHGRHRAAAGTARRELRIPGIAGDAEQRVVRVALERELGHVGLADDERAARPCPAHRQLVMAMAVFAQGRRAPGGGQVAR